MSGTPPCGFDGVTVRYGRKTACDDVSFSVEGGSVYALLGRNGAGKSSLIRCLLGQQRATEGRVSLFGDDAWSTRHRAMARVGVVPEQPDAPATMSSAALSRFCGRLHDSWHEAEVMERLDRFGVDVSMPFGKLSRGQQQATLLALSLGHHPELLVLDDPTLGLDVVAREMLVDALVGELADRGVTVLLATHDLARFEGIATRVGILHAGKLLLDEDLEALKGCHRRIRFPTAEDDRERALEPLAPLGCVLAEQDEWGVQAVVNAFDAGWFAAVQERIPDVEAEPMSLEQIFVAAVGGRGAS